MDVHIRERLGFRAALKLLGLSLLFSPGSIARAAPEDDINLFIDSLSPEAVGPLSSATASGITVSAAVHSAISQDPALKGAATGIQMGGARLEQAMVSPNPQIDVELQGPSLIKPGKTQQFSASISQLVELGDKRTQRMQASEADIAVARNAERTRLVYLICLVKGRFLDVLVAQERLELARSQQHLASEMERTVAKRANAGAGEPMDLAKAKAAVALVEIERAKAERGLETARRKLGLLLPENERHFARVSGSVKNLPVFIDPADLEQKLSTSPAAILAESQMLRSTAMLGMENSKRTVDVTIKAGVLRDWERNDTSLVLGLSVPLPVFDRNRGNIHEAALRVEQSEFEQQSTKTDLRLDVVESLQVVENARDEIVILEGNVVPETEKAYNRAREVYSNGTLGYLDVLDAQRSLFETRLRLLEARMTFHKSYIDLERLVGSGLAVNSYIPDK